MFNVDLSSLNRDEKIDLLERLNEFDKRLRYNKLSQWFPTDGPFRRALYSKAVEFFDAGKDFKERVIFGGNRSGKSTTNNYEVAIHATGSYPTWWTGKRFHGDVNIWCAGDSHTSVRDIAQFQLLGNIYDIGSGMIPKSAIIPNSVKTKAGVPNAIESLSIRRKDNSVCTLSFKSYEQGRRAFQGVELHVVSFDEEPTDSNVYSEALTRTMTVGGIMILSFTPLSGLTEIVLRFLPNGQFPENHIVPPSKEEPYISRWITQVTWEDVPHLKQADKDMLWSSYLPYEKEARRLGLPSIGSGRIYTVPESDFVAEPFNIPYTWPRFYGFDFALFGGSSAAVWMTYDEQNDVLYVYDCYKASAVQAEVHAAAVRRRGSWIPGVIDPSATKSRDDGKQWLQHYLDLGLDLELANNSVDPGIAEITKRLNDGRLRVMSNCTQLIEEYRLYRLDKNLKVAKNQKDDLMDAWRYGVMSGLIRAISLRDHDLETNSLNELTYIISDRSRSEVTGY